MGQVHSTTRVHGILADSSNNSDNTVTAAKWALTWKITIWLLGLPWQLRICCLREYQSGIEPGQEKQKGLGHV